MAEVYVDFMCATPLAPLTREDGGNNSKVYGETCLLEWTAEGRAVKV